MYTDIHAHVFNELYDDVDEILSNLDKNKIRRIVISGYDYKTNKEVISLVNKYDNVYGTIGIHPNSTVNNLEEELSFINENINNPKILAVGEIGLDFYRNTTNKDEQIKRFKLMLDIAKKNNKPIVVHSRESNEMLISILGNYNLKGVMHSFTGNLKEAKKFVDLGYMLSVNGIVTFKNSDLSNIIKEIDIKNILLETDSPYLTPHPYRKYTNEPKYVSVVFDYIKDLYDIEKDELTIILEENFKKTFDI